MTEIISTAVGCPTERAVVRVLLYFEIFAHPLTAEEVFQYSDLREALFQDVQDKLQKLVSEGVIFQFSSFFQTQNDSSWIIRRHDNNRRADRLLPVARRMARFIGMFPFVRGVFVSGSLSKHSMRADSDIDFFIITEPERLWLARTLLVCFKKIFLFNSHKYFCVNYFVDTRHIEIEEKNLFTAIEIATLLPMYGREWYEAFYRANGWVREFFPHFPQRPIGEVPQHKRDFLKRAAEWSLAGRFFNWLDIRVMHLTVGYWKRKFRHFDECTFDGALKSRRYVSKHHPLYFQQNVLEQYARRVASFEKPE